MTRKSRPGSVYPAEWKQIAKRIKAEAGWACIRCGIPHNPKTGHTLTVHHLDMDPSNIEWWNLVALCQRCHLTIQAKVTMERPFVMFAHTDWFKPYVSGYYAWKYLDLNLSRADVMPVIPVLEPIERELATQPVDAWADYLNAVRRAVSDRL